MSWIEWATVGISLIALGINAISVKLLVRYRREFQE
jgi:hypothetical protein